MSATESKWNVDHYVTVFELARQGTTKAEIAKILGVGQATFYGWLKKYPGLQRAFDRGRSHGDEVEDDETNFHEYVYKHLPPHLRDLWDEIMAAETADNHQDRIEAMLAGQGKRAVQHLFVHSLVASNFNVSRSLRRLNVPRKRYEGWVANDPHFAELIDQIHEYKKDFIENAFIGRIMAGDTAAILHGVKTQLRDRGYNDRIEMVVEHDHRHRLEVEVSLDELELTLDVRRAILAAVKAKQSTGAEVIDSVATKALPAPAGTNGHH